MAAPSQNVNLSVSDPVSADIQAVCTAVTAVCEVLKTTEGQLSMKAWRESSTAFNTAIAEAGQWFLNLFKVKP